MAGSLRRGDYQCGSRKEDSITDNLFTLRSTLEKSMNLTSIRLCFMLILNNQITQ
jgi:hypothetical protein